MEKVKVNIKVNTDKEKLEHLISGGILQQEFCPLNVDDCVGYYWLTEGLLCYHWDINIASARTTTDTLSTKEYKLDLSNCTIYKTWEESLPLLCMVLNEGEEEEARLLIVDAYDTHATEFRYQASGCRYNSARPATEEEAATLIYKQC